MFDRAPARLTARIDFRSVACTLVLLLLAAPPRTLGSELEQPPTRYPLCTSASLAAFPWNHPAFGKSIPGIALRSMSLATCRIAGYPKLRAYALSGTLLGIRFERRAFIDSKIYAYSVTPGAAVFFAFYGHPPRNEYDRSCVGITRVAVALPQDQHAINLTISTGTCGGRMSYSQIFPVSELSP